MDKNTNECIRGAAQVERTKMKIITWMKTMKTNKMKMEMKKKTKSVKKTRVVPC